MSKQLSSGLSGKRRSQNRSAGGWWRCGGCQCRAVFCAGGPTSLLIDSEATPGSVNSSRNSGVIHAGLYYASSPIKEKLCIRGKHLLYDYCREKNIRFQQPGKLIVAQAGEEPMLNRIFERAVANEVPARLLQGRDQKCMPRTILCCSLGEPFHWDRRYPSLMQSLVTDFEAAGGLLHCRARVLGIDTSDDWFRRRWRMARALPLTS